MTEAKRVSQTARAVAGTTDCSGVSIRTNKIPEFIGAGLIDKVTLRPECKPIPTALIGAAIVRCLIMAYLNSGIIFKASSKLKQHRLLQISQALHDLKFLQLRLQQSWRNDQNEHQNPGQLDLTLNQASW